MKLYSAIIFVLINLNLSAQNLIPFNDGGKYGLCDIEGKLLLEPKYDETRFFSAKTNGYAVQENGKYGLMDKDLKLVIPFLSINPISESKDGYLVYISDKEVQYYSKNYQLTQKKNLESRTGTYGPLETIKDEDFSDSYSNEKVLALFNKKYPNKGKINVVSANNTYYELCSKTEGDCNPLGVFLPRISVFLMNNEKDVYKNVTWNPTISKYIILVKNGSEEYVIDQDKKVIFPSKEYDRLYIQKNYIGYKDKNSSSKKSVTHYYIISSGTTIENKFSAFNPAKTLTIDGRKFEIFRATINDYKTHRSDNVYIGENGKSYFKVDYEFDN
ncbi:WG repeat-containing protein [Epilithonimonas ginsengisoli]|uniref:WG repeat-containing protein n=1 Tax=Epilithonimonas ginsengisoli TaxID=1245592 RepID=A0ABU4JL24_9FLAO|nr:MULTISPECIES: WG repeat-containing protein [Chryseobacterium group]MBV6881448.1 WG repeat-containing protein [Epilithonimonas sp. FP105]MDW8550410.1 WG repeat-containing protein [Epilithonimonas ginsengisoli]OAH73278.1 hypothetical protein AXA65_08120 [Chryseobacterium sp. FP211-J200]